MRARWFRLSARRFRCVVPVGRLRRFGLRHRAAGRAHHGRGGRRTGGHRARLGVLLRGRAAGLVGRRGLRQIAAQRWPVIGRRALLGGSLVRVRGQRSAVRLRRDQRTGQPAGELRAPFGLGRRPWLQRTGHALGRPGGFAAEIAGQRGQSAGRRPGRPDRRRGGVVLALEALRQLLEALPERERVRLVGQGGELRAQVHARRRARRRATRSGVAERSAHRFGAAAPTGLPVRVETRRPRRGGRILRCRHDSPRSAGQSAGRVIPRITAVPAQTHTSISSFPSTDHDGAGPWLPPNRK